MNAIRRLIVCASILARDSRIPRPLRGAAAVGLLPLPGPLDEAILLLVAVPLLVFYRQAMRDAWQRAALGSDPSADGITAAADGGPGWVATNFSGSPMRSSLRRRLSGMSNSTQSPTTTTTAIGVAMFTIADQDAAIAYYTQTLGWELRADVAFGDEGGNRWVEVAPPGSTARLALNPPMGEWQPGGSAIGVETSDVNAEYARVTALDGVTATEPMGGEGPVPRMFSIVDPDGNHIWVVQSDDGR